MNKYKIYSIVTSSLIAIALVVVFWPSITSMVSNFTSKPLSVQEQLDIGKSMVLVSQGYSKLTSYGTGLVLPVNLVSGSNLARAKDTYKQYPNSYYTNEFAWVLVSKDVVRNLCNSDHENCPGIRFPIHSDYPNQRVVKGFYTPNYPDGYVELAGNTTLLLFSNKCLRSENDCFGDKEFSGYFSSSFSKQISLCSKVTVGTKVSVFGYPLVGINDEEVDLSVNEGKITKQTSTGFETDAKVVSGNTGSFVVAKEGDKPCVVGIAETSGTNSNAKVTPINLN